MAICNTKQVINDVLERIKEPGMRGQSSGSRFGLLHWWI